MKDKDVEIVYTDDNVSVCPVLICSLCKKKCYVSKGEHIVVTTKVFCRNCFINKLSHESFADLLKEKQNGK